MAEGWQAGREEGGVAEALCVCVCSLPVGRSQPPVAVAAAARGPVCPRRPPRAPTPRTARPPNRHAPGQSQVWCPSVNTVPLSVQCPVSANVCVCVTKPGRVPPLDLVVTATTPHHKRSHLLIFPPGDKEENFTL